MISIKVILILILIIIEEIRASSTIKIAIEVVTTVLTFRARVVAAVVSGLAPALLPCRRLGPRWLSGRGIGELHPTRCGELLQEREPELELPGSSKVRAGCKKDCSGKKQLLDQSKTSAKMQLTKKQTFSDVFDKF